MIDPQVAYDKLVQFDKAEDLREYFQLEQIHGIRGNASQCPIAKWLHKTTEWDGVVTVAEGIKFFKTEEVRDDYLNGRNSGRILTFPMTSVIREFVDAFDLGFYPELGGYRGYNEFA